MRLVAMLTVLNNLRGIKFKYAGGWFTGLGGRTLYWQWYLYEIDKYYNQHIRFQVWFNWWRIPTSFYVSYPKVQEGCDPPLFMLEHKAQSKGKTMNTNVSNTDLELAHEELLAVKLDENGEPVASSDAEDKEEFLQEDKDVTVH